MKIKKISLKKKKQIKPLYFKIKKEKQTKKKLISYLLIIIILLLSLVLLFKQIHLKQNINFSYFKILSNKSYKFKNKKNESSSKKFSAFLPKIKINNDSINDLKELYNSRELFINGEYITNEYIKYIRPLIENENEKHINNYSEILFNENYFKKREDQYSYKEFVKLCQEEKLLLDTTNIKYDNIPLISIIVCSYNKEDLIIKSIRSIQNQSFKNTEIIIVDDASTDNSISKFKYLLESDPRIRIFTHSKNMGLWRSRLDGYLYSNGKYIIFFDISDFYEDNYVLEDIYNLMEKFNLDSLKMIFRVIKSYDNINYSEIKFHVYNNAKIVYGVDNIIKLNEKVFDGWGNIWNRIIKKNILLKSLNLINDKVLNVYQNRAEDVYYNLIINKVSSNFLVIERVGNVYYWDGEGEGTPNFNNENNRNKAIQQEVSLLYYEYNFLPKDDNKKKIISKLEKYNNGSSEYKLNYFRSRFYILNDLLNILIEDPYVLNDDKIFLNKLLNESITREKNIQIQF